MLEGKVAIVTGASSGIGLAVARKLAERGAKVALVARTRDALEKAAREVASLGRAGDGRAAAFPLDVKDFAALGALPSKVVERFGSLDIVVNNAGLNHRGPVLRHSPDALADVITTNLTAPIYLTRAALPHIGPGGVVVNVASLAGMVPVPDEAAYSASKAGLRAFTRSLAIELEERSVRAAVVSPGPVDTTFFGDIESVPDIVFSQPMHTPDQVADAVLACIEGDADEIAMPALSGKLATMGYVFPKLARALRPLLEKRGAANKRAYIATKRRAVGS
jgi:NAD(P)-dependent dehydrogenase (short-subunit alcohol dehydrogenase family)